MKVAVDKVFCTTRVAACLLGVSIGTVQVWVESGLLQAWKTRGGHRRVLRSSIEKLLCKAAEVVQMPLVIAVANVPTSPHDEVHPLHVLVIEDDENLLNLYRLQLAGWPMAPAVSLASSGVSGLLMLGRHSPDLLIMDFNIPGIDGYKALHELCKSTELRHTTIVLVTGVDAKDLALKGQIPDGIVVLPKPVPFDRLKAIATKLAGRKTGLKEPANYAHVH